MSEEELDKEKLEVTKVAINVSYWVGYDAACQNIIDAIGLIPTPTMTKEHIVKLIQIVQRVSKEKK